MNILAHRVLRIGIMTLLLSSFGCSKSTETPKTDANLDSGRLDTSESEEDSGIGHTGKDTASPDCSPISETDGWELCSSTADSCTAVFTDGAGCHEVCNSVNLGCSEVWDNINGECAPNSSNPELGCDVLTGHDSDYCVCSGPVGEPPEESSETEAYEDLLTELVGFGANTTGGKGGTVCTVTSTANSGSGSLRSCVDSASGPWWIRFAVDGKIALSSRIDLSSNLTVDGRDRSIEITGAGLRVLNKKNVIITDLSFHSGADWDDNDAIQVKGGDDIWVHHCSLASFPDGLLDLTKGTKDVTVSWNKFSDHDKVLLISANDNDTEDKNTRVTLHHNWFKETKQRHPRIRHGKLHAYNNFIDRWGDYGMGCSTKSECYSERNVFHAGDDSDAIITQVGKDDGHGEVESHGDLLLGLAVIEERGSVFNPSDFYSYSAEATTHLVGSIQSGAGAR
jgi:pectate lyase